MSNQEKLRKAIRKNRSEGNYGAAASDYEQLAQCLDDPSEAYLGAALCSALSGNLNDTVRLFESFFWATESPSFANLNDLLSLYHRAGLQERSTKAINRLFPSPADNHGQPETRRQVMIFTCNYSVLSAKARKVRSRCFP